jgi:hypothetical protein
MVSGKMFETLFAMLRVRARLVPLAAAAAALLAAACGTSPTAAPPASGPASGSVDTPQGRVEISLQGGTFAQGPEAVQGFTPPQGLQAPYGAVRFTARVGQPGGVLTLRVRLPQPLMLGSSLLKQVGTSHLPLPIEASGNEVVYRIADGGPFDADGTRNGTITDPWWVATGRFAVAITSDPSDWAWRADITHQCVLRGVSDPQTISVTVRKGSASSLLFSFHPVTRTGDPLPAGIRFSPNPFTLSLDGRDPQFTEQIPVEISGSTPPDTYKALVEVSEPGQPPGPRPGQPDGRSAAPRHPDAAGPVRHHRAAGVLGPPAAHGHRHAPREVRRAAATVCSRTPMTAAASGSCGCGAPPGTAVRHPAPTWPPRPRESRCSPAPSSWEAARTGTRSHSAPAAPRRPEATAWSSARSTPGADPAGTRPSPRTLLSSSPWRHEATHPPKEVKR